MLTHLRILAWNLRGKKAAVEPLATLCRELDPHLTVICEAPDGVLAQLVRVRPNTVKLSNRLDRLEVFSLDASIPIVSTRAAAYGEALELALVDQPKLLVVAVHLESRVWQASPSDQRLIADETRNFIEKVEEDRKIERTIVIGDFNMDPFTPAMVDIGGLNAVSCRRRAARITRTSRRVSRRMFYNPMWNLLGDAEQPPGSYYWNRTQAEGYFWHMLDQVLVRPILAQHISQLRVITHVGATSLASTVGRPVVSDHFPIFVELALPS